MNYFNLIPTELIEIIISYISFNDFESFLTIINNRDLLNWYRISTYRYNDSKLNLIYLSIDFLKIKLKNTYISRISTQNIYKLRKIDLSRSKLKEIPRELFNLINLQTLKLNDNEIEEIPKEIGNLVNLKILNIEKNKIKKIPKEIGKLVNLQILELRLNKIKEIPKEIMNLPNLDIENLNELENRYLIIIK